MKDFGTSGPLKTHGELFRLILKSIRGRGREKWRKAPETLSKRGILRRTGWGDHGAAYPIASVII